MDDETINKNIKIFIGELKNKVNLTLFILIFVGIGFIASMFITKHIHDHPKPVYPTATTTDDPQNPGVSEDDEEWPDDSAKTRLYNQDLSSDLTNAIVGLEDYRVQNYGKLPYDDDTWKRAYRDYIKPYLIRTDSYTYKFCDMVKGGCRMPNELTWKDDKLVFYFATSATCDHKNNTLLKSNDAKRVSVYMHMRGETNGISCRNN